MQINLVPLFAFLVLVFMGLYFFFHPSYEKSLEAKYYYEVGQYEKALALAKEAFAKDKYNRMSATIMAQSLIALKYVKYNEDAKNYLQKIMQIVEENEFISDANKAKIRLMCEVMINSYKKLSPSVITDKDLVQKAKENYEKFEQLLEKVHR
ncbi:hypothetical protein MNB_SM-3-997 [hydrothermal vent metagenome]|uniref:Uncharacterized protein n=1 Tax=hydrothermal vent metagenome TaxID=652676 RepID=A0A1W1D572_9ZZZZ